MKIAHAGSRRLIAIVALLIAALGGLTACGSAAGSGSGGAEETTIRYQSYAGAVDAFLLADALGEFEGLTLERVGDITGGPQALQALVSNQTDIGGSAFYGAIAQLVGTGAPIKAVVPFYGSNEKSNSKVVVLKNSGDQDGAGPDRQEGRGQHPRRQQRGGAGHLVRPGGSDRRGAGPDHPGAAPAAQHPRGARQGTGRRRRPVVHQLQGDRRPVRRPSSSSTTSTSSVGRTSAAD